MSTLTQLYLRSKKRKDGTMLEIIRAIKHEGFIYPAAAAHWISFGLKHRCFGSVMEAVKQLRTLRPDSHVVGNSEKTQVHGTGYRWDDYSDDEFLTSFVIDSYGRHLDDGRMPRRLD
jgi:hypothetical protein